MLIGWTLPQGQYLLEYDQLANGWDFPPGVRRQGSGVCDALFVDSAVVADASGMEVGGGTSRLGWCPVPWAALFGTGWHATQRTLRVVVWAAGCWAVSG